MMSALRNRRSGSFGVHAGGSCRAGPAMGGSGSRYVRRRSGSFGPRRSACARCAAGRDGRAGTGASAFSYLTCGSAPPPPPPPSSRRLGLERLERLERAPELGHGGAR